jgi:hypothetical protein
MYTYKIICIYMCVCICVSDIPNGNSFARPLSDKHLLVARGRTSETNEVQAAQDMAIASAGLAYMANHACLYICISSLHA